MFIVATLAATVRLKPGIDISHIFYDQTISCAGLFHFRVKLVLWTCGLSSYANHHHTSGPAHYMEDLSPAGRTLLCHGCAQIEKHSTKQILQLTLPYKHRKQIISISGTLEKLRPDEIPATGGEA
ncbi:hypothetical protein IFM89_023716 [Coptis chinensis]|uniref:Uncharacterized protein n=1 Tax=Coptis chinensis TaxID=261450 RepID=A0A835LKB2_9MAGN|nr:hypothetical protein IFM89_023716 [Coptis chinensis]